MLVHVQEDREFRDPDRFQRRFAKEKDSQSENHYPDIHLDLTVLFIANSRDYVTAWNQLAQVIGYAFRGHVAVRRRSARLMADR